MKKVNTSHKDYGLQVFGRSRITNGTDLLPSIDGRSIWARRLRDLINLHTDDLGGEDTLSTAEMSLIRRASCLVIELERLEIRFASSEEGASAAQLHAYQQASSALRRLYEAIGLKRQPKDITPTLDQYLRSKGHREAAE